MTATKTPDATDRLRRRLIIAGILAAVAVALTIADGLARSAAPSIVNDFASAHTSSGPIDEAINAVLARYKIVPKSVNSWRVLTPDKKLLRVEQRIDVPPDFPGVEFNHRLNQEILRFGARVAATERSKEKVVTMHILNRGVIIRTMSFAMRPHQ